MRKDGKDGRGRKPKKTDSRYVQNKKHKLFRKLAGIEFVIGHCKADHR
ncbi:hypothetical protein [Prevotella ihumii]